MRMLKTLAQWTGLALLGLLAGCGSSESEQPMGGKNDVKNQGAEIHRLADPLQQEKVNPAAPKDGTSPIAPLAAPPAPATAIAAGNIDLTPVADTSIAGYPSGERSATAKDSEQSLNYGQSQQIKIKRQENMALLKFDFSKVPAGATLTKAEMIVTMANGKAFNHMGVYSVHVDWNEGEGNGKAQTTADTGACYIGPKGPATKWREYVDCDFSDVAAGNGGNGSCVTRAKDLGKDKWSINIDPLVIYAAIQDGQTLCLNEETGAWSDKYSNAFIYSREAGADKQPVLKLTWQAGRDESKPAFAGKLTAQTGPWPGSLILNLPKAYDDSLVADAAALPAAGYTVVIDGTQLPQVQVPRPSRYHRETFVTNLPVGKEVKVDVTAWDEAGNSTTVSAQATTGAAWTQVLAEPAAPPAIQFDPVAFKDFDLKVVDGLTLYDPRNGDLSAFQTRALHGKPGEEQRLQKAVRGQILGFQILVQTKDHAKKLAEIKLRLSDFKNGDSTIAGGAAVFHREHFVKMEVHDTEVWAADPLQILGAEGAIAVPSQPSLADLQTMAALYVDLLVPKQTAPGLYTGALIVTQGEVETKVPMAISVADVTLPDTLSFVLEMNAYGHPDKELFYAMYRLFHAHRLSYNCLPYGHTHALTDTTLLPLAGSGATLHVTDWSKYDDLYGPILSGSVAKGLPRDGAPATHWYLPFHESWPVNLEATDPNKICWEGRVAPKADKKGYKDWLDKCLINDPLVPDHFSAEWQAGSEAVAKQFVKHAVEKGWTQTALQVFSNHKMYFNSGSLSLWTMDEPQYGRDYRALNWLLSFYGRAMRGQGANIQLRGDVSRPAWMGDRYDEALDSTNGSTSKEIDHELVSRRLIATGKPVWWYGGSGDASTDPAALTALFIHKWSFGCDGGAPVWTATGGPKDWDKTDALRYIVFDPKTGAPTPTMRMKACRAGQEMMELINQVSNKPGYNRWVVAALVRKEFSVKIVTVSKNAEDPGYSTFEGLDYSALDRLRDKLIGTLQDKK